MTTAKRATAGTAAKKVPAKKKTAVKAAKSAPKKAAPSRTMAAAAQGFSFFDVVQLVAPDGSTSDTGRICSVLGLDQYCVHYAGIGCKFTPGSALRLAPPGTPAPDCTGCTSC